MLLSDEPLELPDKTLKCLLLPAGTLTEDTFSHFLVRDEKLVEKGKVPHRALRVAMISDYGIKCGIATYTRFLSDAIRPLVSELKIFAEDTTEAQEESDQKDNVIRCWKRTGDYSRIAPLMREYNPDIIFIQHEFGLFHQAQAWNCLLSQLSRWRTVTVFHTVLDHDVPSPAARQDYLCRSLSEAACPEIIVHTPRARQTLRSRGYSGRIHHIPHGCFPPNPVRLPSTKYGCFPEYSIFQYGFGSRHKGWEVALDVVELLKEKYPSLIYIGQFSLAEYGHEGQTAYHRQLLEMIEKRGLGQHCAIHRGFATETMLSNYIQSCRVALFPYQKPDANWASWGASGAIQRPLSHGVPIVLSRFPQFAEFEGILPVCDTAQEMADTIDRIFSEPEYEKELSQIALQLAGNRQWSRVAEWYLSCSELEDFDAP
jgi:glycosyltransferase involved in cell wall biosynthesis